MYLRYAGQVTAKDAQLSAVLLPEDLLAVLRRRLGKLIAGSVSYTGTIPLISGVFASRASFAAELLDP